MLVTSKTVELNLWVRGSDQLKGPDLEMYLAPERRVTALSFDASTTSVAWLTALLPGSVLESLSLASGPSSTSIVVDPLFSVLRRSKSLRKVSFTRLDLSQVPLDAAASLEEVAFNSCTFATGSLAKLVKMNGALKSLSVSFSTEDVTDAQVLAVVASSAALRSLALLNIASLDLFMKSFVPSPELRVLALGAHHSHHLTPAQMRTLVSSRVASLDLVNVEVDMFAAKELKDAQDLKAMEIWSKKTAVAAVKRACMRKNLNCQLHSLN